MRNRGSEKDSCGFESRCRHSTLVLLFAAPFLLMGCLADKMDPPNGPGIADPGDEGGGPDNGDPDPGGFTVGGDVSGLEADPVVIALNDDETLSVDEDGEFVFETELDHGTDYAVSVDEQPDDRGCDVQNGTGTIDDVDVDDVQVECFGAPALSSISEPMQFHLSWEGASSVNLKFSSDPDCDWDNYSTCADSDMLPSVSGDEKSFGAIADEFDPDTGWYFVAEHHGLRSNQVGARPGPLTAVFLEEVHATHVADDTLYLGGDFDAVGMPTGLGAMLTVDGAELTGSVPILGFDSYFDSGQPSAAVPDGEGGWYIGGFFFQANGYEREHLVRIRADGSVDPDWHANTDGRVRAIAATEERVYVGGDFSEIEHAGSSLSRDFIAALDPETGEVDPDWDPGADAAIEVLEAGDHLIYAGGDFSQVGADDSDREKLAAFDPEEGSVDPDWAPEVTDGANVYALLQSGDTIYVGGDFSEIDHESSEHIAALDATDGALDLGWAGSVDGDHIGTLVLEGNRLFLGGAFNEAGGESREHLAAFYADSGALVADWAPEPNERINAMAAHDGLLYILGEFDAFGADDVPRQHLAAVSTETGELDPDWAPTARRTTPLVPGLAAVAISDGVAYVGETLRGIGAHRTSIAAIDVSSGTLDRDWQLDLDDEVFAIESGDDHLYVGGAFGQVGDTGRDNLAAFSLETAELDDDWNPGASDDVEVFVLTEDYLYAGGQFAEIDGAPIGHLARLDAATGDIDAGWDPDASGRVQSLSLYDGTLYTGGNFSQVAGDNQENLAAIEVADASHDDTWPEASGPVRSLTVHDEMLYVGGSFTGTDSIGGEERDRLAAIDLTTRDVDEDWDPGADDTVGSLIVHDDMLVVGGSFEAVGGGSGAAPTQDRKSLALIDPDSGDVDSDWDPGLDSRDPGVDSNVRSVTRDGDGIFVGGIFTGGGGGSGSDPDHRLRLGLIKLDPETGELLW